MRTSGSQLDLFSKCPCDSITVIFHTLNSVSPDYSPWTHFLYSFCTMSARKKKNKKTTKPSEDSGQSMNIAENRRARHRFEILEQIECGVVLLGSEVKSLRDRQISLDEAYVRIRGQEIYLVGADIAEYRQATVWNHAPRRPRKLLVHARQLLKLKQRSSERGLTLIPLRIYFNARGLVKVMVGICRGKKLFDKRASLKDADMKRQVNRVMKRGNR